MPSTVSYTQQVLDNFLFISLSHHRTSLSLRFLGQCSLLEVFTFLVTYEACKSIKHLR